MCKHKNTLKRTRAFSKSVRRLSAEANRKLSQVLETLARDPFAKGLQLEKLEVPKGRVYSVRLSKGSRLIYKLLSCGTIVLLRAGKHEVAYRPY